jgi:hypothetical protein
MNSAILHLNIRGGHTGYHYKNFTGFSFSFIRNPFDWYKSLFKFNAFAKVNTKWEIQSGKCMT